MKTTVDIPKEDLREAMQFTGAKTKKEAIVYAIRDFNHRQRLKKLAERLGTLENFMTPEELEELRESE